MLDEHRKLYLAQDQQHDFSSDAPHNTGIMVIGSPGDPAPDQRTIVVTGQPRGGTTMVAECLATLGLPMGVPQVPPKPQYNFEDRDFLELLHREDPGEIDLPRLQSLVQARNEAHPVWGFKLPMAINSLDVLERELRNPRFILVYRDVVAVASREVISVGMEALYAMRRGLVLQERMINFAESSNAPCMLLSYEKALQFPAIVVDLIVNWCGWPASAEQIQRACSTIEANRPNYVAAVSKTRGVNEVPESSAAAG
jgi:hypothetical protein